MTRTGLTDDEIGDSGATGVDEVRVVEKEALQEIDAEKARADKQASDLAHALGLVAEVGVGDRDTIGRACWEHVPGRGRWDALRDFVRRDWTESAVHVFTLGAEAALELLRHADVVDAARRHVGDTDPDPREDYKASCAWAGGFQVAAKVVRERLCIAPPPDHWHARQEVAAKGGDRG